jgi:hypothetical protein
MVKAQITVSDAYIISFGKVFDSFLKFQIFMIYIISVQVFKQRKSVIDLIIHSSIHSSLHLLTTLPKLKAAYLLYYISLYKNLPHMYNNRITVGYLCIQYRACSANV